MCIATCNLLEQYTLIEMSSITAVMAMSWAAIENCAVFPHEPTDFEILLPSTLQNYDNSSNYSLFQAAQKFRTSAESTIFLKMSLLTYVLVAAQHN